LGGIALKVHRPKGDALETVEVRFVGVLRLDIDLEDREEVERFDREVLRGNTLCLADTSLKEGLYVGKVHVIQSDLRGAMLNRLKVAKEFTANIG
jgi:hypothetical protein